MTEFKQLQDAADMTNNQVAEYFDVTLRTVFRWRSGESQPSAVVVRAMGNLSTARLIKKILEVSMSEMSIDQTIENAVMNHDRLNDEVEALRESLRLKEAECEALAHDKSVLLSFVRRVSELDIEDWNYETDDGDGMCFEFIGETEIASDAAYLIEDIEGADNENQNQQAD